MAKIAAWICSILARKRIKPRDILPEAFPTAQKIMTPEEKQRELEEIRKEVGL